MATPANWGKLVNFMAGLRKPALIPFGYFSPNDNIGFIASLDGATIYPTGTTDGIVSTPGHTFVFASAPSFLVVNGMTLYPSIDYAISGFTVTLPFQLFVGDKIYGVS